jgi:hypothetical protein
VETWLRELGFPALPPGPVRIGQSWTDSARVPLSSLLGLQGEAIEVRTTTLEAVQQTPRESIARFSVETTWADAGEGPVPDAHVQGASTQTVLFDIRKGVFLNSRGTSRILVEVGSGTGAPPLTIEAEGSYETRLLEADD